MSNFIYYEKLEDYEEQVRKAKECDKKDKEIERLNNIINEFDRYIDEIIAERIEKMEGTRFLKGGFTIEQNYLKRRLHERLQELKGNNKDITKKSDCNYEKVGKEQNNVI